jgi:hypothetical protein
MCRAMYISALLPVNKCSAATATASLQRAYHGEAAKAFSAKAMRHVKASFSYRSKLGWMITKHQHTPKTQQRRPNGAWHVWGAQGENPIINSQ